MIDKRIPILYSTLFGFFTSIIIVLMILLFMEYRFFCNQAQQLLALKNQYATMVMLLEQKINGVVVSDEDIQQESDGQENDTSLTYDITEQSFLGSPRSFYGAGSKEMSEESPTAMAEIAAAESSDAPDNDDDYVDDSFVIINRQPDYLKQSTLDYIESQELNALMTQIDIDRWSDYTDYSISHSLPTKVVVPSAKSVKKESQSSLKKPIKKEQKCSSIVVRQMRDCGFIWPIDTTKFWLSSLFGPRKKLDGSWGFHHGIDMAAAKGTAVKVARAGTVIEASYQVGYGNTVLVEHPQGIMTRYAHLHTIRVNTGQKIKQGAIVGTVGETGFIRKKGKDGSHLHFEVYEHGKRINPMHCLPRMT